MISINDALIQILTQDMETKSCFLSETLNLSQYSKSIQPKLDEILWKKTKLPSVVVALYRLQENCKKNKEILSLLKPYQHPNFHISQITTFIDLVEFTIEKNDKTNKNLLKWIQSQHISYQNFLSFTIGQSEITVVTSQKIFDQIETQKLISKEDCVFLTNNLGAVTIRFGLNVLEIPNVTFEIMKLVAIHNINITEIVSTSRELTLIIDQKNVSNLNQILQQKFASTYSN
jgi:aspartokinase